MSSFPQFAEQLAPLTSCITLIPRSIPPPIDTDSGSLQRKTASHTMSTSTNKKGLPSGRHSSSQLSRLCRACQSVLTRDDLKLFQSYPHHSSLEDLIEAKGMDCYICSYLFRSLGSMPDDIQEALRLAAEGRTPDNMVADETYTGGGTSDPRADLVRDLPSFWGETPGVSFTCLILRFRYGSYLTISGALNPSYEGYFPLNTTAYDGSFRTMWDELSSSLQSSSLKSRFMVVPDQGILILILLL